MRGNVLFSRSMRGSSSLRTSFLALVASRTFGLDGCILTNVFKGLAQLSKVFDSGAQVVNNFSIKSAERC